MVKNRNVIKTRDGVDVSASATDTDISAPFNLEDNSNVLVTIFLSEVSEANAITFSLKDSPDNGTYWQPVGDQSQVAVAKQEFAADTDVDPTTDQITLTTHGRNTGDLIYVSANGATLPTGVSAGLYYVIRVDADTIKLATSQANALAGTDVDITADGTGNCAVYGAVLEIRMVANDSSDYAQLPLNGQVKVVANTGASDTCTVSAVYVSR